MIHRVDHGDRQGLDDLRRWPWLGQARDERFDGESRVESAPGEESTFVRTNAGQKNGG